MFIILAPVFFSAVWLVLFNRRREFGLRRTFLEAALVFFAFIAATTEIFSLFGGISASGIILTWSAASAFLLAKFHKDIKNGAAEMRADFWQKIKAAPKFYLVLIAFIYLVTLLIALVSPPNTYDSMTYHMARVGHWIQNGTVAFYPTAILRQLYNPPLSEYAIMHFQLLAGSDHFANLVQWLAFALCGAAVSLIVQAFGLETKFQVFAMLLGATIPTAVVQSTSTQNDLFVAFFVLAFFYFFTRAAETNSWADFLWTGTALGLAILAKGSAYLFCFPIGLFFVVVHFLTLKGKPVKIRFVKQVAALLLVALALNAAHYARTTALFGAPVSTGEERLRNENLTARIALANLVRNYANHLGSRSRTLNAEIEDSVKDLLGDEVKNPASTWLPADFPFDVVYLTHEDRAGNLVHLLLITIALLLLFLIRGQNRRDIYGAAFAVVFGYVLFSLLLKWQIWGSRLQMPLFMLGACLVAAFIGKLLPRAAIFAAVLCFTTTLSFLFYSAPRRILSDDNKFVLNEPRAKKYFKNLPDLEPLYTEAARFIKQQTPAPAEIGIYIDYNEFEYPLWILLKKDFAAKPALRHVGVANVSQKLTNARPLPEYVISTRPETTIEAVEYTVVWSKDIVKVLRKKETAAH